MTAEQKRFVLSNDKGDYSQLNPVSVQEASRDEKVEVKQLAMEVPQNSNPETKFIGNYYLLDLQNFSDQQEAPPSKSPSKQPRPPVYENIVLKDEPQLPSNAPEERSSPPNQAHNDTPLDQAQCLPLLDSSTKPQSLADPLVDSLTPVNPDNEAATRIEMDRSNIKFERDLATERLSSTSSSMPIDIPHASSSSSSSPPPPHHRRKAQERTRDREPQAEPDQNKKYEIVEENDVMVSSLNPNYQQVVLRGSSKQKPREDQERQQLPLPAEEGSDGAFRSPNVEIISNPNDPFAGLVQSCSNTAEDEDTSLPRHRLTSVWDDIRVDNEWNQVNQTL